MLTLLIKNRQGLIYNSKSSKPAAKQKEQLNRGFISTSVMNEIGDNSGLLDFIKIHFDISSEIIVSESDVISLENLTNDKFFSILNFKKINDIRYINKYLETINVLLPDSGLYLGRALTYSNRKASLLKKYPVAIRRFAYFVSYIFLRVLPKLPITKKIYFHITKGKGRVISKAEVLGRLCSCGFEIIDYKSINNSLYFVAKKIGEPYYDKNPTYGPIIGLNRVGKNGIKFKVYKLRTMHPYSEYLQDYIYKKNQLKKGGKIKDDFRISDEGKVLRKFWIDELPMLINVLKREMKLVGVRPLSYQYFSLYSEDLQALRTKTKPGLIPPFYVDMPSTLEEIMASERKYLKSYEKSPFKTDFIYLIKSLNNILIKRYRSS